MYNFPKYIFQFLKSQKGMRENGGGRADEDHLSVFGIDEKNGSP